MKRVIIFSTLILLSAAAPCRQVSVYTSGFGEWSEDIQLKAEFYLRYLGVCAEKPMIVRIMTAEELPENLSGLMDYEVNEALQIHNVVVKIRKGLSARETDRTLAHELVHVAQYANGDLLKADNAVLRWQGQIIFNANTIPYFERVWEKEAFSRERELIKAFQKSKIIRQTERD